MFKLIMLMFLAVSCASMKSGQYVYVEGAKDLQTIASEQGLSIEDIRRANPDKTFQGHEWIFIPSKVGLAYFLQDTYAIQDYKNLGTGQFLWPVPNHFRVSSHFGPRGRRHHDGIDIPAPSGTPIVASDHGVVVYSDNKIRGYGNLIVVSHGKDTYTVYAHNRKNIVNKGERVKRGQVIAQVGSTGRSTGPHLHFEIRMKNKKRNPAQYLSRAN
ncbi:MAG TPA: M23 family metallopeptidase [Bacteriovoracaceae bacterium]|nr:M23 family metallopeptidase [Bacteriovoracaceae bacterium]